MREAYHLIGFLRRARVPLVPFLDRVLKDFLAFDALQVR